MDPLYGVCCVVNGGVPLLLIVGVVVVVMVVVVVVNQRRAQFYSTSAPAAHMDVYFPFVLRLPLCLVAVEHAGAEKAQQAQQLEDQQMQHQQHGGGAGISGGGTGGADGNGAVDGNAMSVQAQLQVRTCRVHQSSPHDFFVFLWSYYGS